MEDDVIDIIHKISFDIEDGKLDKLTAELRKQTEYIQQLGSRQAKLSSAFNKTSIDETDRRKKIIGLMERNKTLLDSQSKSTLNLVTSNKQFNDQLVKEQGLIGAVTSKLKILENARKSATSSFEKNRYSFLIETERRKLQNLQPRPNTPSIPRGATGGTNQITGALGAVSRFLPAIGGALSIGAIGSQIFEVTKKFEGYITTLKSAYGSSIKAQGAFDKIQNFAAKTPFSVDELTASFIKLKNRGFDPTTEELTNIGDLASSQGKSFDQLTEAILDAQTGEFERLKEFGIKAKTSGDTVTLAFKGIETQVKKTDEVALRNAVISMGKMVGVAGQMEAQSQTLNGKISNLGDTWDTVFNVIGKSSSGVVGELIDLIGDLSNSFLDLIKNSPADDLRDQQVEVNALITGIASLNGEEEIRSRMISELTSKFPELIRGIDLEKASSEDLLSVLAGINTGYERRMKLAQKTAFTEVAAEKSKKAFNKTADILTDPAIQKELARASKRTGQDFLKAFNEASTNAQKANVLRAAQKKGADKGDIYSAGLRPFLVIANNLDEYNEEANNQLKVQVVGEKNAQRQELIDKKRYDFLKNSAEKRKANISKLLATNRQEMSKEQKDYLAYAQKQQGEFLALDIEFGETTPDAIKKTDATPKKKKKEKKQKTAQEIALEKLNDAENLAQAKEEQRNAEYIKKQNDLYQKGEIQKAIFDNRIERNSETHEKALLEINIKYSRLKAKYQKNADAQGSEASAQNSEAKLEELTTKAKERAESEIKAAIESFEELNNDLLNVSDQTFELEIKKLEDQHKQRLKKIEDDRKAENDALLVAKEEGNVALIAQLEKNIEKINEVEKATIDKNTNERVELEISNALKIQDKKTEAQIDALNSFNDFERAQFEKEYGNKKSQIDAEIELLRSKHITDEELTLVSGRKRAKLVKEQADQEKQIAINREIAELYIRRDGLEKELDILISEGSKLIGQAKINNDKEVSDKQVALDRNAEQIQSANRKKNEKDKEQQKFTKEDAFQIADATIQAAQSVISAFESNADREIEIREKRVTRASEIADRGNAEALQLEEKRLDQAQKTKEKFAKQQIALNLLQQVSALALAIAQAAAVPFPTNIGAIAAVITAVGAGIATITQLSSDTTPAFKDGVIDFQGKGTGTSDSNIVKISHGESVINADATKRNKRILEMINSGADILPLNYNLTNNIKPNGQGQDFKIERLEKSLERVENAILSRPNQTVEFDRNGVFAMTEEIRVTNKKRWNS